MVNVKFERSSVAVQATNISKLPTSRRECLPAYGRFSARFIVSSAPMSHNSFPLSPITRPNHLSSSNLSFGLSRSISPDFSEA